MIKCDAEKNSKFSISDFFFDLGHIYCIQMVKFASSAHFYLRVVEKSGKYCQIENLKFFPHHKFAIKYPDNIVFGPVRSYHVAKRPIILSGETKNSETEYRLSLPIYNRKWMFVTVAGSTNDRK